MPVILKSQELCTVVVTVDSDSHTMSDLVSHARKGLTEWFPGCEGFIAGALHVSDDGTRLVQYLQWTSQSAYVECRDHPRWDDRPSTRLFVEHVASGRAVIDARTFKVVGIAE